MEEPGLDPGSLIPDSHCALQSIKSGADLRCEAPLISHCKSFLLYVCGQSVKNLSLRQSGMEAR